MVPHMVDIIGRALYNLFCSHRTHDPYCLIGKVHSVETSQECTPFVLIIIEKVLFNLTLNSRFISVIL
jgi:hypothetical protein